MEIETTTQNAVKQELQLQREESEARAIFLDLDNLKTVSYDRKKRWVWELIQNAKDCVPKSNDENINKVNVTFLLDKNKLTFTHDGLPFTLKEILALVRRTSTKSFNSEEGNTGKFGTGFVTTHVLNTKVKVSGILKNDTGIREFSLLIDRSFEDFPSLQEELNKTFDIINSYYDLPGQIYEVLPFTKFEYELDENNYKLASDSLNELKNNLPFTLLINPSIGSVKIIDSVVKFSNSYSISECAEVFDHISFSKLENGTDKSSVSGLFHTSLEKLKIAIPVIRENDKWIIQPIKNKARLYREFPLIGTEEWRLPFFIQSGDFLPSEPRDGVRTVKYNESKEEKIPDTNRAVFLQFKDTAISFFKTLLNADVSNLHLLVESGFPFEKTEYTSRSWFIESIQKPLRSFFLPLPLVKTVSGQIISITQAKFPDLIFLPEYNEQFYNISSAFYSSQFPASISYLDWYRIISQETDNWGKDIIIKPSNLVQEICNFKELLKISLYGVEQNINWVNDVIGFLYKINNSELGENFAIYPNQSGSFKKKQELTVDPGLNDHIKDIGKKLNIPIYEQLLDKGISHRDGISAFNTKAYFDSINTAIGKLVPSANNISEYEAVFQLVCIFNPNHARERDRWFTMVNKLLPNLAPKKIVVNDMEEFTYDSAELASIKYVCWMIESKGNFSSFSDTFFAGAIDQAYEWLNEFIDILFRNQKYEDLIRKYSVIPVQSGLLKKLETGIYQEDRNELFDPEFKMLYTNYSGKGKADDFLIDLKIYNEKLPTKSSEILTKAIDELFIIPDIEKRVEPEANLNGLFHDLNKWFGINEQRGGILFPYFSSKRPILYIKAFGPEVSKMVMAIHNMNKPIEEIEALANLGMSAVDLEKLVNASEKVGGIEFLLAYANQVEQDSLDAKWRKDIGTAAEKAFEEAIAELKAFDIENPDRGYDFEILLPSSEEKYFVEIKSTVQSKENIKMSSTQGITARDNPNKYTLCVVVRDEANDVVTKDYFIQRAKFHTTIGTLVSEKVNGLEDGLKTIRLYKENEEASSALDDEKYSVFVGKKAWNSGISFPDFVKYLKDYFNLK